MADQLAANATPAPVAKTTPATETALGRTPCRASQCAKPAKRRQQLNRGYALRRDGQRDTARAHSKSRSHRGPGAVERRGQRERPARRDVQLFINGRRELHADHTAERRRSQKCQLHRVAFGARARRAELKTGGQLQAWPVGQSGQQVDRLKQSCELR